MAGYEALETATKHDSSLSATMQDMSVTKPPVPAHSRGDTATITGLRPQEL